MIQLLLTFDFRDPSFRGMIDFRSRCSSSPTVLQQGLPSVPVQLVTWITSRKWKSWKRILEQDPDEPSDDKDRVQPFDKRYWTGSCAPRRGPSLPSSVWCPCGLYPLSTYWTSRPVNRHAKTKDGRYRIGLEDSKKIGTKYLRTSSTMTTFSRDVCLEF